MTQSPAVSPNIISVPLLISPQEIFELSHHGEPAQWFKIVRTGHQQHINAVNIVLASHGTPASPFWMETFMETRTPDEQGPIGFTRFTFTDPEQGPVFWYINSIAGRWHSFRRNLDYACDGSWRFLVEVPQ